MGSKVEIINNYVKVYRSLTELPAVTSAQVLNKAPNSNFLKISSTWSQRNLELGEIIKFQRTFVINASTSEVLFTSAPRDISSEEVSKCSPSEKFSCVIRKVKQDNKKKQYIEIWTQKALFKNFDVSSFNVHGEIYADGEFGSLEWSPSEELVLYVAEKKPEKTEPFYKQKSATGDVEDGEKEPTRGYEYVYKPDWGEQLVDKHQPVAVICDVKSETLKVLEGIPSNYSPGQLLWSKDGNGIFGIAYENEPRRLGLIYCTQRPSFVFYLTLKGDFSILSDPIKSVRSPRLSPDGKYLYWLQRPAGGVHGGCQELMRIDLATQKKEVMIDVVRSVGDTFSGLFLHNLPARCFSKDGAKLFFSSCNKLRNCSYYLDLGTKKVHLLEVGEGSATILDVHEDVILISSGSLQLTPSLKMCQISTNFQWIPITKSEIVCENSVLKEIELESTTGNHKFTYYNALYYGTPPPAASGQKVPLVLFPHGGPHSATVNDFGLEVNFLVKIGYGVLMVNYRGSTGAGQDGVDFLPGNIGDTDVKDNHEAVLHVLKNIPYLDKSNIFLYGRSHGGYLVEHLSAQYPDFYRAVVSGNPVIDVGAMYISSDIPDWATGECSIPYDQSKPLTAEQIHKMTVASPIQLSDKIKAPTLFLLGKKDLRVPYYGGLQMYNALKTRKVKVRLNLYDDNHTLGSVPYHIDCLINTALWFLENKA